MSAIFFDAAASEAIAPPGLLFSVDRIGCRNDRSGAVIVHGRENSFFKRRPGDILKMDLKSTPIAHRKMAALICLALIFTLLGCGSGGEDPQTPNLPPVANAGADRIINQGEAVILDGAGSYDSDGQIVSYLWEQTAGAPVSLTDANTVAASFVAPDTGTREQLVFQLTVQDNTGAGGSDQVTLTANVPPVADAGMNQFSYGALEVALSATAVDEDGTVDSYRWEQIEGSGVVLSGANTPNLTFIAPDASDVLAFRCTVTDNDGARDSDTVLVYVSRVLFSDSFDGNGSLGNWQVVNDTGVTGEMWQVQGGKYHQSGDLELQWFRSYPLGTHSYYTGGLGLTDYQVRLNLQSNLDIIDDTDRSDIFGVMVRYQDPNNYIRFLMSRMSGFLRLERRVNGQFKTLSHSGRGINLGEEYDVLIDVRCGEQSCTDGIDNDGDGLVDEYMVWVYLNDEPIFSAQDVGPASGTVALFTQGRSAFDNVVISESTEIPRVALQVPLAYSVAVSGGSAATYSLDVFAQAVHGPPDYGVKFSIDSGFPNEIIDFSGAFSGAFTGVPRGERTVSAMMVDHDGDRLESGVGQEVVVNVDVGIGGKFLVGFGDSITGGVGDDRADDNDAVNVKILGRGYTPILTSLLSDRFEDQDVPVVAVNEGLSGATSADGRQRLSETLERFPESQVWLILFGTNDSRGSDRVPSGVGCQEEGGFPADCEETFKGNMRRIILNLKAQNKVPVLARVPYVRNTTSARDSIIQEYNQVIADLHAFHNLPVDPPDFYQHFFSNQATRFYDNEHPNGNGYIDIAQLWYIALVNNGILD